METVSQAGGGAPTAGLPNTCLCLWGLWPHLAGAAGATAVLSEGCSVQPKLPAECRHRPSRAVDTLHLGTGSGLSLGT